MKNKLEAEQDELLAINERQKAYYEHANGGELSEVNGFMTNLWRTIRSRAVHTVSHEKRLEIYDIHHKWLGDLAGKKVLELGCGTGSLMSERLASESGEYHAIDLSGPQVEELRQRVGHFPNTHFYAEDFLSERFSVGDFDLIYAHSVFHHFKHFQVLLNKVDEKLATNGQVITFDPLQTWLPARLFRAAYRPFQTDAEWEFPFTRETHTAIDKAFEIVDRIGVYNKAKWALVLGIISPALGQKYGDKWVDDDLASSMTDRQLFNCIQVSYLLQKR